MLATAIAHCKIATWNYTFFCHNITLVIRRCIIPKYELPNHSRIQFPVVAPQKISSKCAAASQKKMKNWNHIQNQAQVRHKDMATIFQSKILTTLQNIHAINQGKPNLYQQKQCMPSSLLPLGNHFIKIRRPPAPIRLLRNI